MCDVGLVIIWHCSVLAGHLAFLTSLLINTSNAPLLLIVTAQNIPSFLWNASLREAPPKLRTTDISLCSVSTLHPPPPPPPAASYSSSRTLGLFRSTLLSPSFGFRHCLYLLLAPIPLNILYYSCQLSPY